MKRNRKKQHEKELDREKKQLEKVKLDKAFRNIFVKAGVLK
jgi:hypothetical protein